MKIIMISDTHSYLEPKAIPYLEEVDEIWHPGDIGNEEVLDELEKIKKVRAVYGNIDGHKLRARTKENEIFTLEDKKFLITHIAGKPPKYNSRVKTLIKEHNPDVLICGHSHILKVEFDKSNNLLFINPGAAGRHGFHRVKTLIRFDLEVGEIKNLEVIEMGKRGEKR